MEKIFNQCRSIFPEWEGVPIERFRFADPKGFSTVTMAIESSEPITPRAVFYRQLEGKNNAICDPSTEKNVFLELGRAGIAAHCYHYDSQYRIEEFYKGRTLKSEDVFEAKNLQKIAAQLHKLHRLKPKGLPRKTYFELIQEKWKSLAHHSLVTKRHLFPPHEQAMCVELLEILEDKTFQKVRSCFPDSTPIFCHNDTYHGNIMRLETGEIKLLDFEFSCLNYHVFDFANLFAETVMVHGLPDEPHFRIAQPAYGDDEIMHLIDAYLQHESFNTKTSRDQARDKQLKDTRLMILLSDYMYAMAALPLALNPIQKIRFIPYALQRFQKFLKQHAKYAPTH
jgi:thiamine kinase-like enzyme